MFVKPGLKGVSTALATIAIILVLVLGMSWMAYMVVLNASQQAGAAGRAETVALKAKELVRVYIWLDPARQSDGTHLNLTRVSFVNEWSGETMINGLLIVYKNQPAESRQVNIKLAAGEEKTYLPSELGISGLDNFRAFEARVKYVQAHSSLGNDFVSLWGRPDRPSIYVTGTTRTDTYTTTQTATTYIPTTSTRSVTRTNHTTTATSTTTVPPPPGTPSGYAHCTDTGDMTRVDVGFEPNGWGSPPYKMVVRVSWHNYWSFEGYASESVYFSDGPWSRTFWVIPSLPPDYTVIRVSLTVVDLYGRSAQWGGGCGQPIIPSPDNTTYTTSTGTPTTINPDVVVIHVTLTSTQTEYVYQDPVEWVTVTSTYYVTTGITMISWETITSTHYFTETVTYTHWVPYVVSVAETQNMYAALPNAAVDPRQPGSCGVPELVMVSAPAVGGWRAVVESMAAAAAASVVYGTRGRRRLEVAVLALMVLYFLWAARPATGQYHMEQYVVSTTTITYVEWVTITVTVSGGTGTAIRYDTATVTFIVTETRYEVSRTSVTITETVGTTEYYPLYTTTYTTVHPCACSGSNSCLWSCG